MSEGSRVINSVLEGDVRVSAGAVVQHCHLQVWRVLTNLCQLFKDMQSKLSLADHMPEK